MSIYLCGNTGCVNRGCEAIIRSTVKLLSQRNGKYYLATFSPNQDGKLARELGINMISYADYPTRTVGYLSRCIHKINPKSDFPQRFVQRDLWRMLTTEDVCLNIGGDTYCYSRPEPSIALNHYAYKHGIKSILWCCSVEKKAIDRSVLKDLKEYTFIFAREQITYQNLINAGVPDKKVIQCCDPAFFLSIKEVSLPDSFIVNNTVGINVSEMVIRPGEENVYSAIVELIKHIINTTDMSICLIPHVYSIEQNLCDYPILRRLYEEIDNPRVSIINEEYTCEEIKYIISNCRFMIAARTHASIAAYSTNVPTLVIGYSVKSLGIAKDLFGKAEGYVIPYEDINYDSQLIESFQDLMKNENRIRNTLLRRVPEYKKTLTDAIDRYLMKMSDHQICDTQLCTGCGVCSLVCEKEAIVMKTDSNGFAYPAIDNSKCIKCGKCYNKCPVSNRYLDDGNVPKAFALQTLNETIRKTSSSGGAFFEISKAVLDMGGVIVGATFDTGFRVKHVCCTSIDQLYQLQGSKYVQSYIGDIYKTVEEKIDNNIPVLFSGTPCQIAGLKSYLNKESKILYTVDIICHGVPSPDLWDKYIKYREREAKAPLVSVEFRNKNSGWKNYSMFMEFQNSEMYQKEASKDPYMYFFINNYSIRESCNLCSFRNMHRQADITLADFWGIQRVLPILDDDKGTSLVFIHSNKGEKLISKIQTRIRLVSINTYDALESNMAYLKNSNKEILSEQFLSDAKGKPFNVLEKQYIKQYRIRALKYYLAIAKLIQK